jgi:acyl carrier protein
MQGIMAKIFDKIKKILVNELDVDGSLIQPSASFIDDLNMDPDDIAEFFTTIEDVFSNSDYKFEIPELAADDLVTVQNLIDYLQELGIED